MSRFNFFPIGTEPTVLYFRALSDLIQKGRCYAWGNYVISQHYYCGSPTVFMRFSRILALDDEGHPVLRKHNNPDAYNKLHVALNPTDVQAAFNPILRVLLAHQIETFKVVLFDKIDEFLASGQFGKIFTIYMDNRNDEEQINIAREIDSALSELNIQPATLATQCATRKDENIECQFVTMRNSASISSSPRNFSLAPHDSTANAAVEPGSALLSKNDPNFDAALQV